MGTAPQGSLQSPSAPQGDFFRTGQIHAEPSIGILRHLFGPVALLATIVFIVLIAVLWNAPDFPRPEKAPYPENDTTRLFDHQLKEYKSGLIRFDAYLSLQAVFIATSILVVIRRSDSLNLFGNSIPLSWLHFFIPAVLVYLWLGVGFTVHELIWSRMRAVEMINATHALTPEYKKLFRDGGWIDGWLLSFVDRRPDIANLNEGYYSGINLQFQRWNTGFLLIVLGTLISAAHASALALVSIGCRRYLSKRQKPLLFWYYVLPLVPLAFLIWSHVQFALGGSNRNIFQIYVSVASIPLFAFLLWLSAKIDRTSDIESLQCLRRARELRLRGSLDPLRHKPKSAARTERTVALIGDSLSTAFFVGSLPPMLLRMWRGWRTNWFLSLRIEKGTDQSVLARLAAFGTITGTQHASVSASVDSGRRRNFFDHLTNTFHFSHQVDEVLTGRFPDLLLIWIGHNDVDWRHAVKSTRSKSLGDLSDDFARRYEVQVRRLLNGALATDNNIILVVFGLINFGSFFQARAQAEQMRCANKSLFPHLESSYKYFVSMKPEYRTGMVELAITINEKLKGMCNKLREELAETNVHLVYSDAMSIAEFADARFLCPVDAWHASLHGHEILAESAYPIVHEQAQLLGWDGSSKPPARARHRTNHEQSRRKQHQRRNPTRPD